MNFKLLNFLVVFFILLSTSCKDEGGELPPPIDNNPTQTSWLDNVIESHPRVFFNQESFVQIKQRALNEENQLYQAKKLYADYLLGTEIVFSNELITDGSSVNHEYGMRAAEAAFVYLVTGDSKYLELTKKILTKLVNYYEFRNQHSLNIAWRSFSRINALAAFDWIYNDLTPTERNQIGGKLLHEITYMLPYSSSRPSYPNRSDFTRENRSDDITVGFYGTGVLKWYAGLVFYKTGINDALALNLLKEGYNDHMRLIEYRKKCSGDDGGTASACLEYALKAYPWAELNFAQSFKAATHMDISQQFSHMALFPNFVYWNWITGDHKEFGFGDADHWTNGFKDDYLHLHLSQILHLFGDSHPEIIPLSNWMRSKAGKKTQNEFPLTPFYLTDHNAEVAGSISEDMPTARFFEHLGIISMRSGDTKEDTYALFTADGTVTSHRHYDNNHFTIYKKGFVAMDTGTRPEPGIHLSHYYSRTVAHNCITIRMPGETMPSYWGNPAPGEVSEPVPNDGGQNNNLGSRVTAFDETDEYVYIASDATGSYHSNKAKLVLRQFVYILPDIFIVYDHVESKNSSYSKTWLLHTATEPVIQDNVFYADQNNGRLFCRTLLPESFDYEKIGGAGKQFWSDGKHWGIPTSYRPDNHELYGQWRMEVSPQQSNITDKFLHLIQVGDKSTLSTMIESTLIKNDNEVGVQFMYGGKEYVVKFASSSSGVAKGSILIKQDGNTLLEENFRQTVKKQSGYFR